MEAARNAAAKAAEEAATGAWLRDFEAGQPLATPAPGLAALMFRASEEPPAPTPSGKQISALAWTHQTSAFTGCLVSYAFSSTDRFV